MAREWVMPATVTARCPCGWRKIEQGARGAERVERAAGQHAQANGHRVRVERIEEKTIDGRDEA